MLTNMFDTNIIYFIFAMLTGITTVILIPREVYKRFLSIA